MVQLLKRNHDTLMEKYELFRQRNESLEKLAVERETLSNDHKLQTDKLSSQVFRLQKTNDEVQHQKEMLEHKVRKFEEGAKAKDEQIKTLRIQKEKFEGQNKVFTEQLELVQNSHDELSTKKSSETDLLSREITQLTLKERDTRQKLMVCESECNDVKDQLRSMTTELDTRTQENDHLISLLEDQE